jgi:hypothetical protein
MKRRLEGVKSAELQPLKKRLDERWQGLVADLKRLAGEPPERAQQQARRFCDRLVPTFQAVGALTSAERLQNEGARDALVAARLCDRERLFDREQLAILLGERTAPISAVASVIG